MKTQECKITPQPKRIDGFLYECPTPKEIDCSPIYYTSRPDPDGIPNEFGFIEPEIVCFGTNFTSQEIPANAKCWCGNGFKGNNNLYWIWELCMANNCIYCEPTNSPESGFIGGITLFPNCCSMGFNSHPYWNLNACGGSEINPSYNRLCCSPVCQSVYGKSEKRTSENYILEVNFENNLMASSYIEEQGVQCGISCCSSNSQIVAEYDVIFGAASPSISIPNEVGQILNPIEPTGPPPIGNGQPNFIPVYLSDFSEVKSCQEYFNGNTKLKVAFNIEERDKDCYTKDVSDFFIENFKILPPIHGARIELALDTLSDGKVKMSALLDSESQNKNTVYFNLTENVAVSSDFKLDYNKLEDLNYPNIEASSYFNESSTDERTYGLIFKSMPCPSEPLFVSNNSDVIGLSSIVWPKASISFWFYKNKYDENIYMSVNVDKPNAYLESDPFNGFYSKTVLIEKPEDLYNDIVWQLPTNYGKLLTMKVNLYE